MDRMTVAKYFKEWVDSEEALEVKREWWTQYKFFKATKPEIAFEALTRVLLKMTKEHVEVSHVESDKPDEIVFDLTGPQEGKREESQVVRQDQKPTS